ncbi:MAG: hypothetical protein ABIO67_04745 [Mycobacteriales bacterium]
MRTAFAVIAVLAAAGCSSAEESEPPPSTPQVAPSPSNDVAGSAPQGRWRIVVSSDSPYYPSGTSTQELTFRILCADECMGTLETEGGTMRTVHWDGQSLVVELPEEESGPAQCFDARQQPVTGSARMTVRRTHEFVLAASAPDDAGRPTRLAGAYDEDIGIDEQSRGCGFPGTFTGTWSWDLTALDSTPAAGEA